MSSAGMSLLNGILTSKDVKGFLQLGVTNDHFGINEADIYLTIKNHIQQYGCVPATQTMEAKFGIDVVPPAEPVNYYVDVVKKKYLQTNLKKSIVEASDQLKLMNPEAALEGLTADILKIATTTQGNKILDFRDANEVLLPMYKQAIMEGDSLGLPFGWEYLDNMTGGIGGGDILSIVGRPAMGKTFLLLYIALHAWKNYGKPVMFVSMEMKPAIIFQRLAAMFVGKPLTHLLKGGFITKDYQEFFKAIAGLAEGDIPFYVIDGTLSSTAEDIWILARQLTPEAIFVDGAYLVKHPDTRMNKYTRIEANCELFKSSLATDLDVPVCLSYQLNREATKKNEEVGLEHIAGSDAIGQLSSIVLGLMQSENVETLSARDVSVLKGRNGEQGKFPINWDFYRMDFSQRAEDIYDDLTIE